MASLRESYGSSRGAGSTKEGIMKPKTVVAVLLCLAAVLLLGIGASAASALRPLTASAGPVAASAIPDRRSNQGPRRAPDGCQVEAPVRPLFRAPIGRFVHSPSTLGGDSSTAPSDLSTVSPRFVHSHSM